MKITGGKKNSKYNDEYTTERKVQGVSFMVAPNTEHLSQRKPVSVRKFRDTRPAEICDITNAVYVTWYHVQYNGHERLLYNVQVRHDCASQRVQQDLQEVLDWRNDRLLLGHQLRDANPHPVGCLG